MNDKTRQLTFKELRELFANGTLKESDNDCIIFDKGDCDLMTEKLYTFSIRQSDAAYMLFEGLDIPAEGA